MKCSMFCLLLLLPFAVLALEAQLKDQRRHVLIFLNEALGATTERATPAKVTAKRNPVDRPLRDQDSNDLSDMQSEETAVTPGYPGPDQSGSESKETSKDHDSYEVIDPKAAVDGRAPSRRKTRAGTDNMLLLDKTGWHVKEGSQEQIKGPGKLQGSRLKTDLDSEEGSMVRSASTSLRIQAERVDVETSRETSWESSEVNNGKLDVVHKSKETRKYISSETPPFAFTDPRRLVSPVKSGRRPASS